MADVTLLHVLNLEDDPADSILIEHFLRQEGFDVHLDRIDTREAFVAALDAGPDVVLADHALPRFSSTQALALLQEGGYDIPFVVVSGLDPEDVAVKAVDQGVAEVVHKEHLGRLGAVIRHVLEGRLRRGNGQAQGPAPRELSVLRDETDWERVEASRNRAAARTRLLHEISRGILAASSLSEIMDATLSRLAPLVPHLRSAILEVDYVAQVVNTRAVHPHKNPHIHIGAPLPFNLFGDLDELRVGQLFQVDDLAELDGLSPMDRMLLDEGIRAMLVVPIRVSDQTVYVLTVGSEMPGAFEAEHVEIAREVADMLTLAIRQARNERELVEAKVRAEVMTRLQSSFLANMSHEIRTPLTGILGFAEILGEEVEGEEHRELAQVIQESGQRLLETLNALIDLSQLESGTLEMSPATLDVATALDELCQPFADQAASRGLDFHLDLPARPARAYLDRFALARVVGNLLSNAFKFTARGSISVSLELADDHLTLAVQDTGVGIGSTFLPHVFDSFKQESDGLGREFEGSGLGLAITKQLVGLMGGTIEVESRKGAGATFHVELPRWKDQPPAPQPRRFAGRLPRGEDVLRPARILAVEDNAGTQRLVKRILSDVHDLTLTATGEEALERAAEEPYDLVLLDINLGSGIGGEEVLRRLRDRKAYAQTPVLALTAHALHGDRSHFLASGFDGYMAKPFKRRNLMRTVSLLAALGEATGSEASTEALSGLLDAATCGGAIDDYTHVDGAVVVECGHACVRMPIAYAGDALERLLGYVEQPN